MTKDNSGNVKIPCDMCDFTSISADDFIKHIETKHQKKADNCKVIEYKCGRCDYEGRSEEQFKRHLEIAHSLNVGGFTKVNNGKFKRLCINWNRGHCSYDTNCKFEHKEMTQCIFKERCARVDCTYWHEAYTMKFPFLEFRPQFNPNPSEGRYYPSQKH